MTDISIEGGRALLGEDIVETSLQIADGEIATMGANHGRSKLAINANGLKVLPGIIDLHGDAFERQMMPRPGVDFPVDVALVDSDRQAIANGITTVFHATTWSWEPGLRSADNARDLLEAIEQLRPQLAADTRFHLRHETYNLDAEAEISQWLTDGRVDLFAFNDHMDSTIANMAKPQKRSRMVERTGLSNDAFDGLVERVVSRADAVPASIARLAEVARNPTSGCCRMTMKVRRCERRFGRRASASPNSRSTRKPRGKPPRPVMPSCSARPMSFVAVAIPDGPGPPT
jgi:alpha-D-ribose 1-methylphosphonate 5-triphosphate diphosphatase